MKLYEQIQEKIMQLALEEQKYKTEAAKLLCERERIMTAHVKEYVEKGFELPRIKS
jgi:hypothetical protein